MNILAVIISGLILNNFLSALLFLTFLVPLRLFCGGYHAKTYFMCNIVMFLSYLGVYFFSFYLAKFLAIEIISILFIIGYSPIYIFCPMQNKNKNIISPHKKKKFSFI
jgi:accessory gene regulator B